MKHQKLKFSFFTILLTVFSCNVFAQSVSFPDDARHRGYYDRPYKRYEAEQGKCVTNGTILTASFDQQLVQSEASNQVAVQLSQNNSYVQWTNDEAADGMVIRFSIPDNTTGTLKLYVNDSYIQDIQLDSKWAWQYFPKDYEAGNDGTYPYNTSTSNRFPRMRFDEVRVKLANKIPADGTFKLVKENATSTYTIDFVELEPVPAATTFASIADANKVQYTGNGSNLQTFIDNNGGKTIFIPAGKYDLSYRLYINSSNTKIIGAGMWYTQLHFTADPGGASYSARGIQSSSSNITLDGLYLTTVNDRRYRNYANSNEQVGKGLNASFGSNSVVKNIWVEHFECGAWIDGTNNLTVSYCRFRNNYADGINLSYGSKNSTVTNCSFRNNGDDDMASWSRGNRECSNNTFRYNTAENNWRASSIALFGGKQNKALNCVVIDPMEAGVRVNSDFDGSPFSTDGYFELKDISVYKGGVKSGTKGVSGNLWGQRNGALFISASRTYGTTYDVNNVKFSNIDLYNSKGDAVHIQGNPKSINNVTLENININTINVSNVGAGSYYGIYFNNAQGDNNSYCVRYTNVADGSKKNASPGGFTEFTDCQSSENIPVSQVIIDPKSRKIGIGQEFLLNTTVLPDIATNKNVTYSIVTDNGIISLTGNKVKGLKAGIARIKVTSNDNNSIFDYCDVTVQSEAVILPCGNGPIFVKTTTAPVIDGMLDAVWNKIPATAIANRVGTMNGGGNTAGFSAQWRALYDDANIYIYVEVTKPTAHPDFYARVPENNPAYWWQGSDAVELFFDGDNSRSGSYDANDSQYKFIYGMDNYVLQADNGIQNTTGVRNSFSSSGRTYYLEAAFPWSTIKGDLNLNLSDLTDIGFEVVVNVSKEASTAGRIAQFASFSNTNLSSGSDAWENTQRFGSVEVRECTLTTGNVDVPDNTGKTIFAYNNTIQVNGLEPGEIISVYTILGSKIYSATAVDETVLISSLNKGIYVVVIEGTKIAEKVLIAE